MKIINKILIKKYPWLKLNNINDYSHTWLDALPEGWRKKFGLKMIKDLAKFLKQNGIKSKDYTILDIKEKWRSFMLVRFNTKS